MGETENYTITPELLANILDAKQCDWQLKTLSGKDIDDVIRICGESFPLDYPKSWFEEVVAGKFISFGLFYCDKLTSLLVAEIKAVSNCDGEDYSLFINVNESHVVYILSLAVSGEFRRKGIATLLLKYLIQQVSAHPLAPRLVFLHVLAENFPAINFYKRNGFHRFTTIKNYYQFNSAYHDGYTMIYYITQTSERTDSSTSSTWSSRQFCNVISAIFLTPFRLILRLKSPFRI